MIATVVGTSLQVNIRNAKRNYFTGKVTSVTSLNDAGEFDILPQHANFISIIRNYVILDKNTPQEKKFVISTGILRAQQNKVDIFLDV